MSSPSRNEILFIKAVFYLMGIGFLLPWNSFISAESYFVSRLTIINSSKNSSNDCGGGDDGDMIIVDTPIDNDDNDGTTTTGNDAGNFMSWISMFYNLSGVATLTYMLLKQRAVEHVASTKSKIQQQQQQRDELRNENNDEQENGDNYDNNNASSVFQDHPQIYNNDNDCGMIRNTSHTSIPTKNYSTLESSDITMATVPEDNASSRNDTVISTSTTPPVTEQKSPQWNTIIISFSFFLLVMITTSTLVLQTSFNNSLQSIELFKIITFICIIICGISGAYTSSGIVSYANMYFPPLYSVQCYIAGQAVGGFVISILNLALDYYVDGDNEDKFWNEHCSSGGNRTDPSSSSSSVIEYSLSSMMMSSRGNHLHQSLLLTKQNGIEQQEKEFIMITSAATTCDEYDIDWGAFSYFTISCLFLVVCIVLYVHLDSHPVTQYYRDLVNENSSSDIVDCNENYNERNGLMEDNESQDVNSQDGDRNIEMMEDHNAQCLKSQNNEDITTTNGLWANNQSEHQQEELQHNGYELSSLIEPLLKDNQTPTDIVTHEEALTWNNNQGEKVENVTNLVCGYLKSPITSIFITFFITLTIFPSRFSQLESSLQCQEGSSRFRNDLFISFTIVLFNMFDLAGRFSAGFVWDRIAMKSSNLDDTSTSKTISKTITWLSMLRLLFLPMFLLCKTKNSGQILDWFHKDSFTFLVIILFSFSNGLATTLSFIEAPTLIPFERGESGDGSQNDTIQNIASTLLNFAVGVGLLTGSLVSFLYNMIGI